MTCRRPTISVRIALLERLARANNDAPDSGDFAPISWSELERSSLTEGLNDLIAYQNERVAQDERKKSEELKALSLARALRREQVRKWEQELTEQSRQRLLSERLESARRRAAEEAPLLLTPHRDKLHQELKAQAKRAALDEEIVQTEVARTKRSLRVLVQTSLAAAALGCVVWATAFGQTQRSVTSELASLWEEATAQEMAAQARVAELQTEIERRADLTESQKMWLEDELAEAKAQLGAAEKDRDSIDSRRPAPQEPRRLANTTQPAKVTPADTSPNVSASAASGDAIRVASDDVVQTACSPYDPLCFDL